MTIDPWQHMLEQIQPTYKHWRDLLEEGPVFVVNIHKTPNFGKLGWRIRITEQNGFSYHEGFDECIEWATVQLALWPDCKRKSWDMWDFKHRRDAEKFRTLFTLKWAQ
jgi:hypothetical protein